MKRWVVLLGCFIGMAVAMPAILLVPLGLFLKSVTTEFGWSRTEFSTIIAAASLFNAVTMPIAGYLVDRSGAQKVIAAGTVLGCGSYAALSLANSYLAFVGIVALTVAFGNMASYSAFMSLAQRWFDKRLGLALAITSTGLAVGIGAASYTITRTIESQGWRAAFLTVGVSALIIGVLNLLLVRDNDGPVPEAERREGARPSASSGSSLAEAVRTRDFWLYSVAFGLVIFAVVGCNVHLPAMLSDRGATAAQIASVVAIGTGGSLFGRLFTGLLLDRLSVRLVAAIFLLGQAAGFILLLNGLAWVLTASFLLGAVQGAEIDMLGYVIARRFGRIAYARIYGTCFGVTLIGAIVGPIVMGVIFDRTGSYHLGLMLLPVLPLVALAFLNLTRSTRIRLARS